MAPPTSSSQTANNSGQNDTTDLANSSIVEVSSVKETDAPKLKSNSVEEYIRWKRHVRWWANDTKMPKHRLATHIMIHGVIDSDLSEKLHEMSDDKIRCDEGLDNILAKLDECLLTHNESKLFEAWSLLLKTE